MVSGQRQQNPVSWYEQVRLAHGLDLECNVPLRQRHAFGRARGARGVEKQCGVTGTRLRKDFATARGAGAQPLPAQVVLFVGIQQPAAPLEPGRLQTIEQI